MLLINKPIGLSSFDVIRKIKKHFPDFKIGHAGTLDPLAEGLLILLINSETKQAQQFTGLDKTYIHTARLGIKTTTGDLEGKIIKSQIVKNAIYTKTVKNALEKLTGEFMWPVPMYSATKVKGKPLYKYARENASITPPTKKMTVYENKLLDISCKEGYCDVTIKSKVSSGTFIRVLNEKLGEQLGYPSTTAHIKRIQIGKFKLSDAIDLETENWMESIGKSTP